MKSIVMQSSGVSPAQKAQVPRKQPQRLVRAGVQLPGSVERAVSKSEGGPIILNGAVSLVG